MFSSCIPNNTDIGNSIYSLQFDPNDVGVGVNLKYFNTGSRGILALATSQGLICGIDTRSPALAFRLKNDLAHRTFLPFHIERILKTNIYLFEFIHNRSYNCTRNR